MDNTADPSEENNAGRLSSPTVTPAQILCMAKGFSRIFWGIFFMVALFLSQAGLEVFHNIRIPAYVVGAGIIGWGAWLLQGAGPINRKWHKRTHLVIGLVFLVIYFAPFIAWWQAMPYESFLLLNVLGLLLAGMWILLVVNLLVADVCRLFIERGGQIESQVFASGVVILMIAPFLTGLLFALIASIRYHSLLAEEIWLTFNRIPIWLYIATTLPCSLTLVASWKVKSLCYQRLWDSDARTDEPSLPQEKAGQTAKDRGSTPDDRRWITEDSAEMTGHNEPSTSNG